MNIKINSKKTARLSLTNGLQNSPSIFLADDNLTAIQHLRYILIQLGYPNIKVVRSKDELLETYKNKAPDLLLMNLNTRDLGGISTLDKIRIRCKNDYFPIIVLTKKSGLATRIKAYEWGVKEFLGQPYYANEVNFRIKSVLEVSKLKSKLAKH
jgi:DNA-binding response OmpR family regulator